MRKAIWRIILCFIALNCLWAGFNPVKAAEYRYKIDFGKARPIESLVIDRSLSIKINPGEDWVKVYFDSFLDNQRGEHIPVNRLNMAINDRNFELDHSPFEIDSKALSLNDKLFFTFSLNLTPADRPGNYQGIIIIETSEKKITFQLGAEVQPWVRIETDQSFIRMDQAAKEDLKLQSSIPLTIRVASNSKWVLAVNLARDSKVPLQLKMDQQLANLEIQRLFSAGGRLETEKKVLAAGNATVVRSESYWTEIKTLIYIDDFIKYPAGEQSFQLRFLLELWDQKTVKL